VLILVGCNTGPPGDASKSITTLTTVAASIVKPFSASHGVVHSCLILEEKINTEKINVRFYKFYFTGLGFRVGCKPSLISLCTIPHGPIGPDRAVLEEVLRQYAQQGLTLAQRVAATNSDLGYSVGYESV
jgi:hypothetical protein